MNLVDLNLDFYFPFEIERIRNLFSENISPLKFNKYFESYGILFDEVNRTGSTFLHVDERDILFDSKKNGLEFSLMDVDKTLESSDDLKLMEEAERICDFNSKSHLFFVSNVAQDINKLISYEKNLINSVREEIANISKYLVSKRIPFYLLNMDSGTLNHLESEILMLFNPEINLFRYKVMNGKNFGMFKQELPPRENKIDIYQ